MARKASAQPTDVELAILRVLWERGPSTVREVHLALSDIRDTGYSTTLKMMQVMFEKGVLTRDEACRPQLYSPAIPQEQTQANMVDDLVQKVFGGSARKLVLRAVQSERVTAEELSEIRKLLKKLEGGRP
ncbi:MAG TPA: BlaI/MecI/CopY family transcriptional regulator [Tepidisphaeraceae bacterium]|jgi:predicted transcriptional regulator